MPLTTYCEKIFQLRDLKIFDEYQHLQIFSLIYLRLFYYWDLKLKINKYWSWTHWLALMIFSSKVDLCLVIKIVYISRVRSHIFIFCLGANLTPILHSYSELQLDIKIEQNKDFHVNLSNIFLTLFQISGEQLASDPNI